MTTTGKFIYLRDYVGTKMIISYGRQAVVSWFAISLFFFFHSSCLNCMFSGMKRLGSDWLTPSLSPFLFHCPIDISQISEISQVSPRICSPVAIYTPGWREGHWELNVSSKNTTTWKSDLWVIAPMVCNCNIPGQIRGLIRGHSTSVADETAAGIS